MPQSKGGGGGQRIIVRFSSLLPPPGPKSKLFYPLNHLAAPHLPFFFFGWGNSPSCPGTPYVNQAGLKLTDLSASPS